jgi:hypothetical protein
VGRLTKRQAQEHLYVYYGINPKTFKVETAYQTRGGVLELWRNDVRLTAPLGMGRMAESECVIVFGLTDVRWLPANADGSESSQRIREELRKKAAEMQAEAKKST